MKYLPWNALALAFMSQSSLLTLHSSLVFQHYTLLCLHLPVPHHIEAAITTWTQYRKLKRQRTAQRPVTRTQPLIRHQRQSSHLKMGLSLSRIYQSVSSLAVWGKDKEVRILMVGLDSAGKTTILYRLQVSLSSTRCRNWADDRLEKSFLPFQVRLLTICSWGESGDNRELTRSNRVQCRDCFLQEYQLPGMGSRRSIEYSSILEVLLCEHTGKLPFPFWTRLLILLRSSRSRSELTHRQ